MFDLYLDWNSDLLVGPNGDLALVRDSTRTNQRVLRRLLTNPGDYIWNLNYGGGLGSFVGLATNTRGIEATIRTQLALEAAVPATPAPSVSVNQLASGAGYVLANITYADPSSGSLISLTATTN